MSNSPSSSICPRCGASLNANSLQGLCARCLGAVNFATETALPGSKSEGSDEARFQPSSPAEIAEHFPQLQIIEFLGRGGMGVVYKVRQKSLGRLAALKLLAPERADDPQFAQRFEQEAKALAALNHPNIVTIYDFGQAGGFYYLLMEFIDGVNLRQAMSTERLKPEQALAIVPPVCEALQYAHEHQIVHRDIKPENLLLDKEGRVKIADFGIAKILGAESMADFQESQPAGTPQYMAPEQKLHLRTDHRADIYSLGVVLYEMLTGELPTAKLQPPSKRVHLDVRIDEIVLRALELKPELRYSTADDFRVQVQRVTSTSAQDDLRGSAPHSSVQNIQYNGRFSRAAIVGAGWITASVIASIIATFSVYRIRSSVPFHGLSIGQLMVLVPAAICIFVGPFVATIFGWIAIQQIRPSHGTLRGLPLALFDALAFPLLAFNGLMVLAVTILSKMFVNLYGNPTAGEHGSVMTRLAHWISTNPELVFLFGVAVSVMISVVIVQSIWQAIARPVAITSPNRSTSADTHESTVASIAMLLALTSFVVGCICAFQPLLEQTWLLMTLILFMAGLAILMAFPMRRSSVSKNAIVIAGLTIVIWPLLALFVSANRSQTATAYQRPVPGIGSSNADATTSNAIPDFIDFKVQRVESVPDARKIILHFERDDRFGLGLEFSQDVIASADGKLPEPGYRDFQNKMFLGANDARQFVWELPEEFDEAEVLAAAKTIDEQTRQYSTLSDGALIEFGKIQHRNGWSYILLARVRREWGAPYPRAPGDALFSDERTVVVPDDTLVRLQLEITGVDGEKQHVGDPLVFKTAVDRATGFTVRWHAYGKGDLEHPHTVLVDVADADTQVAYHRFEYVWPSNVELSNPDGLSQSKSKTSLMLANTSNRSTIRLIRAEQANVTPAAIASWSTLSLEVTNLGLRSSTDVPRFQLPSNVKPSQLNTLDEKQQDALQVRSLEEWSPSMQKLATEVSEYNAAGHTAPVDLIHWGESQGVLQAGVIMPSVASVGSPVEARLVIRNATSGNLAQKLFLNGRQMQLVTNESTRKNGLIQIGSQLLPVHPEVMITIRPGEQIEFANRRIQFGGNDVPDSRECTFVSTVPGFMNAKFRLFQPDGPALETGEVTVLVNDKFGARSTVTQMLVFTLEHQLARNMEVALQQVVKGRPIQEIKVAPDDKTLYVVAYKDVLTRVRTFITVNDATDNIDRGDSFDYSRFSPLVAVRSFFHACAIEDDDRAIANLLSVSVLAHLRQDRSEKYEQFKQSGVADPEWEADLRGEWPGKRAKIRQLVNEWNRFALLGVREQSEQPSLVGTGNAVEVSFLDAPVEKFGLSVIRDSSDLSAEGESYYIDSLPPW